MNVFTQAKRLEPHFLNIFGCQVLRVLVFRAAQNQLQWRGGRRNHDYRKLQTFGCLKWNKYLPERAASSVEDYCADLVSSTAPFKEDEKEDEHVSDNEFFEVNIPNDRNPVIELLKPATDRSLAAILGDVPDYRWRILKIRFANSSADRTTEWHSDIFLSNFELWYPLHTITSRNGAFRFVPGSARIDWRRLCTIWGHSLSRKQGSPRFTDAEIRFLRCHQPIDVDMAPNSLHIINNFGIHARGTADDGVERITLRASVRVNPFRALRQVIRRP